jgi:hypothetical protein
MFPAGWHLVQELEETIRVYANQIQALAVRRTGERTPTSEAGPTRSS